MADFVNPATGALVASANDMPAPWVTCTRAELTAWEAIPQRYRKWLVDHVEEMTQGEKDATDAAALTAQRDAVTAQLDGQEDVLRAFMLVVLDELNTLRAQHSLAARTTAQLRNAVRAKLGS